MLVSFFLHEQRCSTNEAQRLNDFIMAAVHLFIPSDTFYSLPCTCDTHTIDANVSATHTNALFYKFLLRRSMISTRFLRFDTIQAIYYIRKMYFSNSRHLIITNSEFIQILRQRKIFSLFNFQFRHECIGESRCTGSFSLPHHIIDV